MVGRASYFRYPGFLLCGRGKLDMSVFLLVWFFSFFGVGVRAWGEEVDFLKRGRVYIYIILIPFGGVADEERSP